MKTLYNIYKNNSGISVYKDRLLKLLFSQFIDSEIDRHLEEVRIHEYIINNHDVLPGEWHRGRIVEAKYSIAYLQEQKKMLRFKQSPNIREVLNK